MFKIEEASGLRYEPVFTVFKINDLFVFVCDGVEIYSKESQLLSIYQSI